MDIRKFTAYLLAFSMMCGALISCSDSDKKSENKGSEATTSATEEATSETEETTAEPQAVPLEEVELEDTAAAESGDAYLAINDSQGWIQYWGKADTMLAYNAGVTHIDGNGTYTVSVTTDTKGFRYSTTENADDDSVVPSGVMFSAVMIKNGKQLFPDAVITIDSITVDGNEVEMTAKNYTSSDDGVELRSNICNTWVNNLPDDAVSVEGLLVKDGKLTEAAKGYSPVIINQSDFSSWHDVTVTFTVSGIE